MVMIDICDCREVHSGDFVLHDGEIGEIRHEAVNYGCQ